jgi:hypothetical protein
MASPCSWCRCARTLSRRSSTICRPRRSVPHASHAVPAVASIVPTAAAASAVPARSPVGLGPGGTHSGAQQHEHPAADGAAAQRRMVPRHRCLIAHVQLPRYALCPHSFSLSCIVVGNGASLPVSHSGRTTIPTSTTPIHLRNVLVSPSLIKNLISVKTLCRDNPVNVEFDNFGFSIKDRLTKTVILRCNCTGDLYPVRLPRPAHSLHASASTSTDVWHQRLGHPGRTTLARALRAIDPSIPHLASHTCH